MTDTLTGEQMVAAGAYPAQVDAAAMLAEIQKLQAQMASMQAAQGIPADPVAAALQDLVNHVNTRQAMVPGFDFAELKSLLKDVSSGQLTARDVELIKFAVEEAVARGPHEFQYLVELSKNLYKSVLKAL